MSRSAARVVATQVLFRVAEQGAFATAALDAEIRRAKLSPRDAALATEIGYGTLRTLVELDERVNARLHQPRRADGYLRAALRTACYQLWHLSRAPSRAVVNDAVGMVRDARGPRIAAVANAVLRKLAAERPAQPGPVVSVSVPAWLRELLAASMSESRFEAFLSTRPLPPPLGLRCRREISVAELAQEIVREAGERAEVHPVAGVHALALRRAGDPRRWPAYREGKFGVQEIGAQLVAAQVGARPGERIADLCAGRGGKTLALAEAVGSQGRVVAVDLYEEKLANIGRESRRLGLDDGRIEVAAVDLTIGLGGLPERSFDRVLIDAPCTGVGTLHRRPELLLRLGPGDPERLAGLQTQLLMTALTLCRPGGEVVYAVCSPLAEEGVAVAEAAERGAVGLDRCGGEDADPDGIVRIGPWDAARFHPDAYQAIRWHYNPA